MGSWNWNDWQIESDGHLGSKKECEGFRLVANGRSEGFVTVDYKRRGFRFGLASFGAFEKESGKYVGMGWRDRLVEDAKYALFKTCFG